MDKQDILKNISMLKEIKKETKLEISDDTILEIAYKVSAQKEYSRDKDKPTENQIALLRKLGYDGDVSILSKFETFALIDKLKGKI